MRTALLRQRVGRAVRQAWRELQWHSEFRRLERLRGIGQGRRAFLIGNGPSLASMNLTRLDGEFVCVVNMGVRAVGQSLSHADMHVVTDANRYERFAGAIEAVVLDRTVPYRFVTRRGRRAWNRLQRRGSRPYWLVMNTAKLTDVGDLPPLNGGLVTGPSVLISAAVLLQFLGFSPIYVIGCDLDYEGDGKYFYPLEEIDRIHEADPTVIGRRPGMHGVNAHFAVLRDAFAVRGQAILNAGLGGNLHTLQRVGFDSLFSAGSSASRAR
jgi:hypothetical protein